MQRIRIIFLVTAILSMATGLSGQEFFGCDACNNVRKSPHVALGIPSDTTPSDDYLVCRDQYVLSYNPVKNVANWVAWNLNVMHYGDASRFSGKFKSDPLLPGGFTKIVHDDYTNTGYDRGHMVRSEERTATSADNISTFYLTNILPQRPDLNQGVWLNLEYYCENNLCTKYDRELYIVAGGIFNTDTKLNGKLCVPDSCFKIIVILPRDKGLKEVTVNTDVIAVIMPNKQGVRKDKWTEYMTTVDHIEKSTGYDFLSLIPLPVQEILESRVKSVRYD